MTQPPRTTETLNRDHEALREIMHQIRELTVPDRATLAVGLVGHLATMLNQRQMEKLMGELVEEAERVQDVPPLRRTAEQRGGSREGDADERGGQVPDARARRAVGQAGRGAVTEDEGRML